MSKSKDPYKRNFHDWPLEKMAKILKEELKLKGDPIALAWSMEPPVGTTPYTGGLKLTHCQFMQRSRFRGETFVLTLENNFQGCNGFSYIGLGEPTPDLESGYKHSRRADGAPGIYGSPGASRRLLRHYYRVEPNTVKYFSCAPLSNCAFDPDVVTLVAEPRTCMYAIRAAIHYTGLPPSGETGPGTCSTSWIAAYLTEEIKYTLGCRGAFLGMGIAPTEVCLSIPIDTLPVVCQNLEEWKGYKVPPLFPLFQEPYFNEDMPWMKVPYEGPYEASFDPRK
jgi:uncharacterized protein (DUF169 family)